MIEKYPNFPVEIESTFTRTDLNEASLFFFRKVNCHSIDLWVYIILPIVFMLGTTFSVGMLHTWLQGFPVTINFREIGFYLAIIAFCSFKIISKIRYWRNRLRRDHFQHNNTDTLHCVYSFEKEYTLFTADGRKVVKFPTEALEIVLEDEKFIYLVCSDTIAGIFIPIERDKCPSDFYNWIKTEQQRSRGKPKLT